MGGAGAVTLSEANYQALLVGWSAQTLQSGVVFSGGNSSYSGDTAIAAKGVLTNAPNNWVITDGGINSYTFADKTELQTGVNLWISNESLAIATYGQINNWVVSAITDMSNLFLNKSTFNSDISNWDVSNATDFSSMFSGATIFDQNISSWDMSSALVLSSMFANTNNFNQNISGWTITGITAINSMFANANSFNQNLNSWDVSNAPPIWFHSGLFYLG